MEFTYSAKSLNGETSTGILDADTVAAARRILRDRGLFPLRLTAATSAAARPAIATGGIFGKRVTKAELMLVTSQLVIMCRTGVELAEAVKNVASKCRNPKLKTALEEIHQGVSSGQSFSSAMRKQVHLFGETYVASVAAGEASGKVPDVLARMSEMLNNEIKLNSTIKGAISYPIVLMAVCLFVIAALLLFVLPNFERVFQDMGVQPPVSTQILLEVSGEIRRRIWLWGTLSVSAGIAAFKLMWTERVRRSLENSAMRMVLFGEVLQALVAGRLFVMLGTMLQNGVPLVQSLQLCRSAMRSMSYCELLDQMQEEVLNGRTIGRVLDMATFVPAGVAQMIGTAERSGKLGSTMQLVGEYYEADGQRKLQELAKLLEPLIIIVMGIIVAFVVASIMLPMLDISNMANQH